MKPTDYIEWDNLKDIPFFLCQVVEDREKQDLGYAFDNTINSKVLCFAFGLVAEIERFPVVGNCRNDRTILEDRIYAIEKHGFCREHDFDVSQVSPAKAVFTLSLIHI